jgi:TonB-linked SusC/RagA family outer membrane protein
MVNHTLNQPDMKSYNRYKITFLTGFILCSVINVFANPADTSKANKQTKLVSFNNDLVHLPFGPTIESRKNTAALSMIKGDRLKGVNTPTLGNTLMGQLSGLYVSQSGGAQGNTDFPGLFVRGRQTFQDNNVLVLVDGFETNWFSLLPEEIESVSVLKDAAALSQFGMDAANGAVLITTKRGTESSKTKINFTSRFGVHSPRFLPDVVNNGDYATMFNEGLISDGKTIREGYFRNDSIVNFFKTGEYPFLYPDVDWYKEVVRPNALSQDYALSFSGGRQDAKYYVALGFADYQGLYTGTETKRVTNSNYNLKRYNLRVNFDVNITKFLSAQTNFRGTINDKYFPNASENTLWRTLSLFNPYPVITQDGRWAGTQGYADNPKATILQRGYQSINDRTVDANVKLIGKLDFITKGLRAYWQINFSNFFFDTYNKTRSLYYDEVIPRFDLITTPGVLPYDKVTRGTVDNNFTITQGNGTQFNRSTMLSGLEYGRSFGDHEFYAAASYYQETFRAEGAEMPFAEQRIMGRVMYNFKRKYFAELGYAYSGSENFPKGNRFGFFPSLSAGWIMSDESFMQKVDFVNFLKMRASWGLLGNDNTGNAGRFIFNQNYVGTGNYLIGNNLGVNAPMFNQGNLANRNVTWEKANRINVGFESVLFHKFSVAFDYFYERRTDIFLNPSSYIPAVMGVNFAAVNRGKTKAYGAELELNYKEKISNVTLNIGGNISFARNKIIDIAEFTPSDPYLVAKGNPINQPFVLEFAGFYRDQADINSSPQQLFGSVRPGDIKYKDQNGDGVIDNRDRKPFGNTALPQLFYGANASLNYKSFDFFVAIQGAAQRTVSLLDNNMIVPFLNGGVKPSPWVKNNYWTSTRMDMAKFPRLTTEQNDNNYRASTLWQRDGSFLRLQTVEIGYQMPIKWSNKIGMDGIRFFVSANNLLTIDRIDEINVDPEVMNPFVHPPLKSFNFGFTLKM